MTDLLVWLVKAVVIYGGLILTAAAMTLAERKVSAWLQLRYGPNRVGPWGLFQPVADGIKSVFKEELIPAGANPVMFRLAPVLAALPAMMTIAVIPFGGEIQLGSITTTLSITDLDIGLLFVLAIGGLGVYGAILGGWSSNSKYSLMGGLRASAQMISYELSMILTILAIVVLTGSLDLQHVVARQSTFFEWNVFAQPLAFVIFVIATFAETNRHPFDFAECEPELVGGFHTEYSSLRFALFFLAEYCAMVVMACLTTVLFLGGSSVPFFPEAHWLIGLGAFFVKAGFFLFLFLWVRWTLPRFRFDQLMGLGWKVLLPLALANLLVTGAFISLGVDLW